MVDLLHIVLAIRLDLAQQHVGYRIVRGIRITLIVTEVVSAVDIVVFVNADVTRAVLEIEAPLERVLTTDVRPVIAVVVGQFGAVERPPAIESKRRSTGNVALPVRLGRIRAQIDVGDQLQIISTETCVGLTRVPASGAPTDAGYLNVLSWLER